MYTLRDYLKMISHDDAQNLITALIHEGLLDNL